MHDDEPQPTTKPWLDRKIEQLARECEDGRITPHEMTRQILDACEEWAAQYLTPAGRAQVREQMEELAFTDLEVRLAWRETE